MTLLRSCLSRCTFWVNSAASGNWPILENSPLCGCLADRLAESDVSRMPRVHEMPIGYQSARDREFGTPAARDREFGTFCSRISLVGW